jgi:NADPH:quinone reductase
MPRAVIADELGPPENYRLREFDPGPPQAGEVRVAIKAAGVSFVDVLTAMGRYQIKPDVPFIPGSEFAGVVEAVGEGVAHLAPGDRVFGSSFGELFAEAANLRASNLSKIPAGFRQKPRSSSTSTDSTIRSGVTHISAVSSRWRSNGR